MGIIRRLIIAITAIFSFGLANGQTLGIIASQGATLEDDQFWILDSAKFNFGPEGMASIPGYTNVEGEPSTEVVTATSPNGWTISTVGTDTTLWNPSPLLSDKCAVNVGNKYTTPSDPYGYKRFDSSAIATGFLNYGSESVENTYNLEISGLDPDDLYQFHIIGSITYTDSTSWDVYGSRTLYRSESGQEASLNTQFRTSKSIVLDTVKPNSSGIVRLSITGQDTTYSKGSMGIISAMEIYHISRDSSTGAAKTELFKNYYDTAIFINDGGIDRLCIVYKPYNYDPSQSYPIFLYLDGQEDAVKEGQWDPQVLTGDGIGIVGEGEKGKLYALRDNGDTASFVMIIPQTQLNEFSLDNTEINNILDNFKALDLFNTNDSLFIAGFSSGGASVVNYLYGNPSKVTAAFIQSPAAIPPASSILRDSSLKFKEYGTHVWITTRGDAFAIYTDTIKKYIYAADSSLIYEREWFAKDHSGFAYEYRPDVQDGKYPQNIYDFFFNPTQNWRKFSKFVFRGPSVIQLKDWIPVHLNGFVTPSSRILVGTDSSTGFSVTTIATNLWSGVSGSAVPVDVIRNYNFWTTTYVQGTNVIYKTGGSYAANGNNIRIRGLVPGRSYTIFLGGHSDTSASPHVITQYGVNGTDFGVMDNTTANEETPPVELVGIASDSGTIGVSVYPDPNSTNAGVGQIGYLMVRETENYVDSSHKSPLVNAGSDATITLPLDSVTLTATYKNLNHFSSGGDMASATWSVVDEPEGASTVLRTPDSLTTIAAELTEAGDYYFEFSATDDSVYTSKDTVKIHVFDASAPVPVGDRILIDLAGSGAGATSTTSPQDDGRYWNTLDGALTSTTFPLVYDEFVDTAGNVVNMSVTQTSTWWSGQNNINIGGGLNDQVGDYPASACIDSWIINSSASPGTLQIKLPAGTYSIKFWGSRTTSGTLTTGIKLSTDETYTTFNASNNSNFDNAAVFTDVVSDGSTAITFNVSGSSSSNSFGYLGLIDIKRTE